MSALLERFAPTAGLPDVLAVLAADCPPAWDWAVQ